MDKKTSKMEQQTIPEQEAILEGYRDLASGALIASSGDFDQDMKALMSWT